MVSRRVAHRRTSENAEFWTSRRSCLTRCAGLGRHDATFVRAPGGTSHARQRRARRGGHPKMRGQDMNAIVEVNFLGSWLPTQRGHIPCSVQSRILRFQMLVDTLRSLLMQPAANVPSFHGRLGCGMEPSRKRKSEPRRSGRPIAETTGRCRVCRSRGPVPCGRRAPRPGQPP
jgi:hypothetical protein